MRFAPVLFVLVLFFSACVKDEPQPAVSGAVNLSSSVKVLITCEGNFGSGNAALSVYDPSTDAVVEDWYKVQNAKACGDVLQSVNAIGQNYFLIVNNSSKIIVCDHQLLKTAEINGLSSPRYLLPISNAKAYVSDLHDNGINIVDLNTNQKIGKIACSGWTEGMQKIYNKVFVCNLSSKYMYVLNSMLDQMTDSIEVGYGAGSIVIDKEDKLWVLVSGKSGSTDHAQLLRIDPVGLQILKRLELSSGSAFCLRQDAAKERLYFLQDGVQTASIQDDHVHTLINSTGLNFYGLGIDPNSGDVYVADAHDYTQASTVYVYNAAGEKKKSFNVGINANGFYFE